MRAWLFDVDGVLTNIFTKKVEHPELIRLICEKLEKDEPVGIITGKRISKTLDGLVNLIRDEVKNTDKLKYLHAEAEFGSVEVYFINGVEKMRFDESYELPEELTEKGKEIIESYKDFVFFNQKKYFYTAEMNHEGDHDEFKKIQSEIAKKLEDLIESFGLTESIEAHQDTIAINVKRRDLNKHLATRNLINWLRRENLNPDEFFVFGDSESDFQIGDELFEENKNLEFIYVGEKEAPQKPYKITRIGEFDAGTLKYLQSN